MGKIRVLVVDDAVVVRRIVSDVLAADPELEVVGTAANGRIALAKIPQVNPDVITLDVEMPEMNGLETLEVIRKLHPRVPVIMFSTLTERGAATTLDALALGASDYVTKPANVGSFAAAQQSLREQLVPKIKAFGGKADVRAVVPTAVRKDTVVSVAPEISVRASMPVDIVAIGVSTGGPNACWPNLFRSFRPTSPCPSSSFSTCHRSLLICSPNDCHRNRLSKFTRRLREKKSERAVFIWRRATFT